MVDSWAKYPHDGALLFNWYYIGGYEECINAYSEEDDATGKYVSFFIRRSKRYEGLGG